MSENEISRILVERALHVQKTLGPGLLESVYRIILARELRKAGLAVEEEVPVAVKWDGVVIELASRADLIIENLVIVELKPIEKLAPVHSKQLLTYLRITGLKLGLLLIFGEVLFKDGIHRIANNLD
jgi:GxxExxY protein